MDKQNVVHTYNELSFGLKKEGHSDTCPITDLKKKKKFKFSFLKKPKEHIIIYHTERR